MKIITNSQTERVKFRFLEFFTHEQVNLTYSLHVRHLIVTDVKDNLNIMLVFS